MLPFFKFSGRIKAILWFIAKFILLIIFLLLQRDLPEFSKNWSIPKSYLSGILFLITANLLVDFIRMTVIGIYTGRRKLLFSHKDNFIIGINQIASIASFGALGISFLVAFEIAIMEVLTAVSIFAAAIAILSKDYVSNMINGMIIMFTDQISLNDHIKIGIHKGRIIGITLLNIQLLNDDDDLIYIPNSTVLAEQVINYTKRAVKKVSIEFEVGYSCLKKVEDLENYLIELLKPYEQDIIPDSYNLKVVEVKKDAALLKFQYILEGESDKELEKEIRRRTVRAVVDYIDVKA